MITVEIENARLHGLNRIQMKHEQGVVKALCEDRFGGKDSYTLKYDSNTDSFRLYAYYNSKLESKTYIHTGIRKLIEEGFTWAAKCNITSAFAQMLFNSCMSEFVLPDAKSYNKEDVSKTLAEYHGTDTNVWRLKLVLEDFAKNVMNSVQSQVDNEWRDDNEN